MSSNEHHHGTATARNVLFATTHWSVVLAAGRSNSPKAADALQALCATYWYPLYAFVRRQGYTPEDAQDLTQEFLGRMLAKDYLSTARQERGKFRWFLLAAMRNFLANEWDRVKAQKRGGDKQFISIDEVMAENQYCRELAHELTAEKIYERTWAVTLLERVRALLREEFTTKGEAARFDLLEQFLPGERTELTYAEVGHQLGLAEGTVKSEMHRLRRRYRQLLRAEIAKTVASPVEIDEELRALMVALSQ